MLEKSSQFRRKRGQQWAFHMESFKKAVDYLYEICRSEHNISACKEAIIYLENSKRDFESLINTINVEASWDESSKPQAVAWEIRKSSHTPVHVIPTS
uniref:SCAPER_N domain-containing protein n=1 Tax=Angiostrongylus cantonensis TaxID=6313 RepID=A0A0K0DEF4_ANGCA